MKTSNKILVTAFIIVIAFMIIAAVVFKANVFGDPVSGDGNIIEQDRTEDVFNKIDVSGNFQVNFTQNSSSQVLLTTDGNLMEYIVTEIKNGELKIYSTQRFTPTELRLDISTLDIEQISSSAGARFFGQNLINSPVLRLIGSAGSRIELEAITDDLTVNLSAGSHARISGQTRNAEYSASAGSQLEAYDMQAENVSASGSSGASLEVSASEELSVKGSSGSQIFYAGTPVVNELNLSSGAAIHQRRR